jgi:epoxyqueuosine reductase
VGIAEADEVDCRECFLEWIAGGCHADMTYLAETSAKRLDVRVLCPGARSVIALAINYRHPRPEPDGRGPHGRVSRYAWGRDYHRVVAGRLKELKRRILRLARDALVYYEVDTGPVLEREWARKAGIGWIGKSANLLVPGVGTMVFLATIVTDLELPPDTPMEECCRDCTLCMEACPTGAIDRPGRVDARKCLSYWTVESRREMEKPIREGIGDQLFGCDVCQEVCPFNKVGAHSREADFAPRPGMAWLNLHELLGMSGEEYDQRFRGSVIRRAGLEGLKRTAGVLLEKSESREMGECDSDSPP